MTERVRIFVSSPGDAQFERQRIDRVVERLNGELADVASLETIRWEREFYRAHTSFQQQIPDPASCEIVIAVLRHRLGTALPEEFARMPNGEPYPSGTAYEILTAIDASRKRGLPDVYVFRYSEPPTVRLDDPATSVLVSEQWERLKGFFKTWFQTPDGRFTAAFHQFRTTDEFEAQVESLLRKWLEERWLEGRAITWPIATKGSPFRGLAAFGTRHSRVFFGRSRDIARGIDALKDAAERGARFLLIIGPSGAGKSSLAHAGVVPRLTTPGVIPTVDIWRVALMRPGAAAGSTMWALAESLFHDDGDEHGGLVALPEIRESDHPTPEALARLLAHADEAAVAPVIRALDRVAESERRRHGYDRAVHAHLLLVVDQLDELFAADVGERRRREFTRLLNVLQATGRVWVIATLRADLYERVLDDSELLDMKTRGSTYDLAPPGPTELAEIVRRPAEAAGLTYETDARTGERLDERVLADADRPDMLPLLQFTLQQLFEQREVVDGETRLTLAAYARLGGLAGAIDKEAERAVAALGEAERARLPRLLRQLAAPAQGVEAGRDAARLTVRSLTMADAAYDGPSALLVHALIEARILLSSGGEDRATIRLAHQRVLESWKRAQDIVAANADFYRIRHEIEEQHRRWEASGRKRDRLIPPGLPLAEAESIRARYADELPDDLTRYIDASSRRGRARQRRQQIAAAGFAVLALIAVIAGVWAVRQQGQAEASLRASRTATSRFLADVARQRLAEGRLGEAVALARHAVPLEIEDWPRVPTAENALAFAMQAYSSAAVRPVAGLVGHEGTVRGALFSPAGTDLLTWSYDGTARLWNVATGAQLRVLTHEDGVRGARFSSDGRRVLTWAFDGGVRLWDLSQGGNPRIFRHDDIVVAAVFSVDETRILSWSYDGTARVWESTSGNERAVLRHGTGVRTARFLDGDGRVLTRDLNGAVRLWRATDGTELATLGHAAPRHQPDTRGATLFARDSRVLTWSDDRSARVWDARTGKEMLRMEHQGPVRGAALSPNESRLVCWSGKLVSLWDVATGRKLAGFEHEEDVRGGALSTDGTRVLAWSARSVVLWSATDGKLVGQARHADLVVGARLSSDGTRVLSWSHDGTAQLWDVPEGGKTGSRYRLMRHGAVVRHAGFSTGNSHVWTQSDDGTVRQWAIDRETPVQTAVLRHHGEVLGFSVSPTTTLLATFSTDGMARLWDWSPKDRFTDLRHEANVTGAAFSTDGRALLTRSADQTVRVWNVETAGQPLVIRHGPPVRGAAFASDHAAIITWSEDGSIRLWSAETGAEISRVRGPAAARGAARSRERLLGWFEDGSAILWNAASEVRLVHDSDCGERMHGSFSEDGGRVLIRCADGTLRTFDAGQGVEIGKTIHDRARGAAFSPDGTQVVSWSETGAIRLWGSRGVDPIRELSHAGSVEGVVFSPRGDRVLSWGGDSSGKVWDATTGEEITTLRHTAPISGAVFVSQGSRVWSWSQDGFARLWDPATGRQLLHVHHGRPIRDAAVVADGRMLLTRGGGVRVWDTRTGDELAALATGSEWAIARDGRHVVTWGNAPLARMWSLGAPTHVLADRASRIIERFRPLSPRARCQAYLDTIGCDQVLATTERERALTGDDKRLRLTGAAASEAAPRARVPADVRVELVVNDRGEPLVFHNRPLGTPLARVEFNVSRARLTLRFKDRSARDLGFPSSPGFTAYLENADRILMVLTGEKGEPVEGEYFPLLVY
jgi:WD40 repeat protein